MVEGAWIAGWNSEQASRTTNHKPIMNRLKTALLLTVTTLALFSCRRDEIHGSGNIITQDRSVPAFENVLIEGAVKANIRYGATQQVIVRTDAVAIGKVRTTVSNNTLVLDLDDHHNYHHINFEVDVVMPVIHRLTHEGVSNSSLSGFYNVDALEVVHDGVGNLEFHGSAGFMSIVHDGVGQLRAFDFPVDTCQVGHSGVGNIEVTVFNRIQGYLSGVGNVYYRGTPQLNITQTGVGHAIHVD